jgi:acyl-coenzyme A thioesterase PaaI-like protein
MKLLRWLMAPTPEARAQLIPVVSPGVFRWLMNWYPPYRFGGVRVLAITPDYRQVTIRVRRAWRNRNANGTVFGGTLYAATDPWHALLYWQSLAQRGLRVQAWTKSAQVEFLRPALRHLKGTFGISPEELAAAEAAIRSGQKYECTHLAELVDPDGRLVCRVTLRVYLKPG